MVKSVGQKEFSYDEAVMRHVETDDDWDLEEERLDSESPWEAAFTQGEELAREEQATLEANWDED